MDDEDSFAIEKTKTVLSILDYVFHENTTEQEALAAVRAYHRLSKGRLPSVIFGDCDAFYLEDIWQDRYADQELELSRLRNEVRKLKKGLDVAKRRGRNAEDSEVPSKPHANGYVNGHANHHRTEFQLSDEQWAKILPLIPEKHRSEKGRERISAILVVLRTGCAWRVLRTQEKPNGWTTYYNQHRLWQDHKWWKDVEAMINS